MADADFILASGTVMDEAADDNRAEASDRAVDAVDPAAAAAAATRFGLLLRAPGPTSGLWFWFKF